jgi:Arc/MetJ family transcription regulator
MKRTNIVLDEKLVDEAKRATGLRTSRSLVDFALRELVRRHNRAKLLKFRGKVKWTGSLEEMRSVRGTG